MARLMATATCTAFRGVVESSGERVGQGLLFERVGFLAGLGQTLTGALVASRWDEDCLDVLAAGVDERDQETRVMLCGCGRTGNAPYCGHRGVCGEHR
ncbi:hypothetical protein [Streptomyces sp. NBC_01618]|uniref:hypothetical protein n=1 Tax=Streptomyces sp. NBC_01618 TaxID=2975900 RepID=UPI0038681C39|nr:hypothetical protein OH735_28980 [Streptomyces sp. NBC_01618]